MPRPDTEKSNEEDPRGAAPSSVLFENAHSAAPISTAMRLSFNQGSLRVDTVKWTWTRESSELRHTACSMCPLGTMQSVRQRCGSTVKNACPRREENALASIHSLSALLKKLHKTFHLVYAASVNAAT